MSRRVWTMPGMTFEHLVDVGLGGVPAQGEDQGALGQGVVQAGADEDVGGPERPGGAGGAGIDDDAFVFQQHHQALAFDVCAPTPRADGAGSCSGWPLTLISGMRAVRCPGPGALSGP